MSNKPPDSNSPIFIVGPPRSGTSLLSAIVGSHSRIACGPETDLFKALPLADARQIASEKNWAAQVISRLDSIRYPDGKSLVSHFGLTADELSKYLSDRAPSAQEIYSAIPGAFARTNGKARWAEKTPRHIFYVETIRDLYPDAKIIRIVRDPRDSVPSLVKNIGLSKSLIGEFYRWMSVYELSEPFFKKDAGSVTIRYEDLVANPEKEVFSLCQFIDEDFEPEMLARSGADHVRVATESWKDDIDKQITADNIYGWKNRLDPCIANAASMICYEALGAFDYPDGVRPEKDRPVFPLGENFGVANESHIIRCAKRGLRYRAIGRPYPKSVTEALEYHPDALIGDLPLGKSPAARFWNCIQAVGKILLRFVSGRPVRVDPNIQLGVGTLNGVVRKAALLFGQKIQTK